MEKWNCQDQHMYFWAKHCWKVSHFSVFQQFTTQQIQKTYPQSSQTGHNFWNSIQCLGCLHPFFTAFWSFSASAISGQTDESVLSQGLSVRLHKQLSLCRIFFRQLQIFKSLPDKSGVIYLCLFFWRRRQKISEAPGSKNKKRADETEARHWLKTAQNAQGFD